MRHARRTLWCVGAAATMLLLPLGANAASRDHDPGKHDPGTRFFVPAPAAGAAQQIASELRQGHFRNAAELRALIAQGHAVWFTKGTPSEVKKAVKETMEEAEHQDRVPVLVAYDIPFRDCGQFSAGGALSTTDYLAWIDGFAKGIGNKQALVMLEPDGLGIIPYNVALDGTHESCQPDLTGTGLTPATANSERFVQMNAAVNRLEQQRNVSVYLDGTHSAWLNVGDASSRLVKAGVKNAQGFFLNVSNYQFTGNGVQYGTWISKCIAGGDYANCPNQYWNGGPAGTMIASLLGAFTGVALSPYGVWSDTATDPALNTSGINARYGSTVGTTHFVIDTSRNGLGPWQFPTGVFSDPQDWCNPPGRGVGPRPTVATGNPLVDAYLWVKVPGESDGQCTRGLGPTGTVDPEWGIVDPAAGDWFPQQALQLAQLANPALLP
ncbi:MAG: endoglucanase [Gaiellaceae bacterium]|nr:endoglucanase [Gaiellaceae bacterium]